jgi:hypothetical protein
MPNYSENKKKYIHAYQKANYKQIVLQLHKEYDKDIIEHLALQKPRAAYIKKLIRDDMHR